MNINRYKHTQIGHLMIVIVLFILVNFGVVIYRAGVDPIIMAILVAVLVLVTSFSTLTVSIDEQFIRIKFGYGLLRKKFPLKNITSVEIVKNKWYYGWGMRYIPWKKMWIFNVSGLDAVELKTKDGKTFRIGTDEPQKLEFAIKAAIQ